MKRILAQAKWERIRANPTLHPSALQADEAAGNFPWHEWADSPKSSQVFCLSAFGTLRQIKLRHQIIHDFLLPVFPSIQTSSQRPRRWDICLEVEDPALLGEFGVSQPTSIDAMLSSSTEVVCIESKFVTDAQQGLGACGQAKPNEGKPARCAGFYGPGSDVGTGSSAWCRLEIWEGKRSPRLYWTLGRQFFRPEIFTPQGPSEVCSFKAGNYQLMRNFLSAAMHAHRLGKAFFGVIVICPERTSENVQQEVEGFRRHILLPQFVECVKFVEYERYIAVLRRGHGEDASELATFLENRIIEITNSVGREGA